ncbi:MAG: SDR family NAD(P)-dependent oxidoreductase [Moraxellaceae bacterium]|nr:SDR family NAD(P)-dependent oxidoreductase [Moraxellaceae bacterium]
MRWNLNGKTALITGAARGFGAGIAERLAARGMNLVLAGLEPVRMQEIAARVGGKVLVVEADVTVLEQMQYAVQEGIAHFGGIDVVVANAGIATVAPLAEIDPALFRKVIEVNLMGVFNTLHSSAASVFSRQGYFLVISSMAYAINSPLQAHYTASKAGVTAMANSFRLEARTYGADVGIVHPTFAKTDMMKSAHNEPGGKEIWNSNTGIWKQVEPEEVMDAIVHAISTRARTTVVPKTLWPVLASPGIFQPILERSFSVPRVRAMLAAFRQPS